ncbi:MAG TPA: hypothetical protein VMI31_17215 [Fimbriimonadaceae bacterium]|nr:hypothetical protein [Fimbriimonadaceae bacterium]
MKNQNDLIAALAGLFVLIVVGCICFFTRPQPTPPAAPDPVNTSTPTLPTNVAPVMADSLPGGSGSGAGPGGGGGGMMSGGGMGAAMGGKHGAPPSVGSSSMGGGGGIGTMTMGKGAAASAAAGGGR